jgi:hypothetical protein
MNKKGFISTTIVFAFFILFISLLAFIMSSYTTNRVNNKIITNDIKKDELIIEQAPKRLLYNAILDDNKSKIKNGTPNFQQDAPICLSYKEDASVRGVYNVKASNNFIYSSTYSFNQSIGKFTLNNPIRNTYSSVYTTMIGQYIESTKGYLANHTAQSFDNLSVIYKVENATSTKFDLIFISAIPKDIDTTNDGLYSMNDDYGTSYYFRGAVSNNWLKFAGFYWRIVRTDGKHSIRIIYAGAYPPEESEKVSIKRNTQFVSYCNFNDKDDSAEYVGYKYTLGDPHGTSTDSAIKINLDSWYESNLLNYQEHIADAIYCNNRNTYQTTVGGFYFNGNGIGNANTHFGDYQFVSNSSFRIHGGMGPMYKCPNKSDAFTVNDTTFGNGTLKYPIALISADEANMAGELYNNSSNANYLYSNYNFWMLTPDYLFNGSAYVFAHYVVGQFNNFIVNQRNAVRPVISLKSNTIVSGTGEWNNPYIVQ